MRLVFPFCSLALITSVVAAACANNAPQGHFAADRNPGPLSYSPKSAGNSSSGSSGHGRYEARLACDPTTNACVLCTTHEQCGEPACNVFEATCLPADAVLHVGPGQPLATIADAVAMVAPGGAATVVVHGNGCFDESITVDGGRTVAFLANDGDVPKWLASGPGAPQLTVAGSTVLLDGLQVLGNGSTVDPGVLVRDGRLWADCGHAVGNFGGGVVAVGGAELVLRNWFVGGPFDTEPPSVWDPRITALESELQTSLGITTGSTCRSASAATIRNAIVVSRTADPQAVCRSGILFDSKSFNDSITEGVWTRKTKGKITVGDVPTTWSANYKSGNLHLVTIPPTVVNTADDAGTQVP